jgi:uncharacterized membrane protein
VIEGKNIQTGSRYPRTSCKKQTTFVNRTKEQKMKANVYDKDQVSAAPQKSKAPSRKGSAAWLVPAALLLLSAIPLIAGVFRLNQLASGAEITQANARFFASPEPVVLHIISAALFAVMGAFQFLASFRRRRPGWHRVAGRFLVACGLLVGFSGLWMTLFYPSPDGGALLFAVRLLFGSAMVAAVVLGFVAVRRHDMKQHRAWMIRGYAIGLGAGTQVLTQMVGELIAGPPDAFSKALLLGAGWIINLAIAEWVIRRRPAARVRAASAAVHNL